MMLYSNVLGQDYLKRNKVINQGIEKGKVIVRKKVGRRENCTERVRELESLEIIKLVKLCLILKLRTTWIF